MSTTTAVTSDLDFTDPTRAGLTPPMAAEVGADRAPSVTERRVLRAEWIKLTTVRSSVVALLGAGVTAVALGAMFSSFAGTEAAAGPAAATNDPLQLALGAFTLVALIIGVVGVLGASSEYGTGLIRTTLTAVTNRMRVLRAKAAVVGGAAFVVGTIAAGMAVLVGRVTYAGGVPLPDLLSQAVVQGVLGTGLFVAGIAVMGVALGFLLRSTAAGVGILAAGLLVVPALAQLLPGELGDWVVRLLPSNAGAAFANEALGMTSRSVDLLSAGAGLAVFLAWVVGILVAAGWALRRRDA